MVLLVSLMLVQNWFWLRTSHQVIARVVPLRCFSFLKYMIIYERYLPDLVCCLVARCRDIVLEQVLPLLL